MNDISRLTPWRARPLSKAAKEAKFRIVMDLNAERVLLGRSAIIAGWAVGAVGAVCIIASGVVVSTLFPLKQTTVQFYTVDQSTGIIGQPVSLADAPQTFSQATDEMYLRRYIEARESWVYASDPRSYHVVQLMSSPDEQARYEDARKSPKHPSHTLGKDGTVLVEPHFRFHQLQGGHGRTRSYYVGFDLTTWRGGMKEATRSYSATVDFAWHPETPMLPDDMTINPGGLQVIRYSAAPDVAEDRK